MRAAFAGDVYAGQILARAHAGFGVCNNSDCNTFELLGTAKSTSFAGLRFPFGSNDSAARSLL